MFELISFSSQKVQTIYNIQRNVFNIHFFRSKHQRIYAQIVHGDNKHAFVIKPLQGFVRLHKMLRYPIQDTDLF